jgi:hypothetical protein
MLFRLLIINLLQLISYNAYAAWSTADSVAFANNQSHIFYDDIRSVKVMLNDVATSNPVLSLGGRDRLNVQFDELNGSGTQYYFKLYHCNANWVFSELLENEYLQGFNALPIQTIQNSMNTKERYVHYSFQVPNVEMTPKVSGNYILRIYNYDETDPALQVRFYVVDQKATIDLKAKRARVSSLAYTHHQLDAEVNTSTLRIQDVEKQCTLTIMQNMREDRTLTLNQPRTQIGEKLVFDNTQTFAAGNEFREFDIRTIRVKARNVWRLQVLPEAIEITLELNKIRGNATYTNSRDINGKYSIEYNENGNPATDAEYCKVYFHLDLPAPYVGHRLFVLYEGNFFKPDPLYELFYNDTTSRYEATIFMKQGFYNYIITDYSIAKNEHNEALTEGNFQATENTYQALFYFRPFNARYDHLLGFGAATSEW